MQLVGISFPFLVGGHVGDQGFSTRWLVAEDYEIEVISVAFVADDQHQVLVDLTGSETAIQGEGSKHLKLVDIDDLDLLLPLLLEGIPSLVHPEHIFQIRQIPQLRTNRIFVQTPEDLSAFRLAQENAIAAQLSS